MSDTGAFLLALVALAVTTFACRAGGYWLMHYVKITPALERALAEAPLAVMIGIVAPAALHGGMPEQVGLAVVVVAMLVLRSDLAAALCGVAAVGLLRVVQ